MRLRTLAPAFLCVAAGACSFDLTEVEEMVPDIVQTPGSFYISITANLGEPLQMKAMFDPGTGADGLPRPIADDTLHIDGVAYAPAASSLPARDYSMVPPLMSPASFLVKTPRLVGEPDLDGFVLSVPGVAPVDTVVVSRGDPIELEISGLVPSDSRVNWSWAVVLSSEDRATQISIVRNGQMPSVLRFPAELLPDGAGRGYIGVNAYSYQEFTLENRRYPIRVQRQLAAVIPLRVTP